MFDFVERPIFVCLSHQESQVAPAAVGRDVDVLAWSKIQNEFPQRLEEIAVIEVGPADDVHDIRRFCPHALIVSPYAELAEDVDFTFTFADKQTGALMPQVLDHALGYWRRSRKIQELAEDVAMRRQRMHQLNEISMALTGRMSQQELLQTILSEARRIAHCEAGSLFLVESGRCC